MSKKNVPNTKKGPTLKKIKTVGDITEYTLTSNGLRVLYQNRTGSHIVTSNIVYLIGSRDEAPGETGIAHMLEHMLFKSTRHDIARKEVSGAMHFERQTGAVVNANTWKDRTTYYFAYPREHFDHALRIEAERMRDIILTDKEFQPERTNVLSEFDMYAGDEQFSLSVDMVGAAFMSHPYGHETIGYRNDIASYTVETLTKYYDQYYRPNNATLTIVGDIDEKEMKRGVLTHFGKLERGPELPRRDFPLEHTQEGIRTITITRESQKNILAIGLKHAGFPSISWHETMVVFDLLGGGKDSILHRKLIDGGKALSINTALDPSKDPNLGIIFITLAPKIDHDTILKEVVRIINNLTKKDIAPYLKKTIAKTLTNESIGRENSLSITAELVEYVSAGKWESFYDTEKILKGITPERIHAHIHELFADNRMTIGYFKGTQ